MSNTTPKQKLLHSIYALRDASKQLGFRHPFNRKLEKCIHDLDQMRLTLNSTTDKYEQGEI